MIKTAKKYDLRLDGLAVDREAQQQMPIWDHVEAHERITRMYTSKAAKCLLKKHKVRTVGEALNTALTLELKDHIQHDECECAACIQMSEEYECEHPNACAEKARDLLNTLPPKWDPRENAEKDYPEEKETTENGITWSPIKPKITSAKGLSEAFRIFTPGESQPAHKTPPRIYNRETHINQTITTRTITIAGICIRANEENAAAGAGIYHKPNSEENAAERVPKDLPQTKPSAELYAIKTAIANSPENEELRIRTTSKLAFEFLTKGHNTLEDRDFIDVKTGKIMKRILQIVRERPARTWIAKIEQKDAGGEEVKMAQTLARAALVNEAPREDIYWGTQELELHGMKLTKLDQKTMYKAIRRRKRKRQKKRERTENSLEITKAQTEELFEYTPTSEAIWRAMRNKDNSKKHYHFTWMLTHDAFMVGDKWARPGNKPEAQENAECKHCFGKTESMTHILTECETPGQKEIWRLTGKIWKNKGAKPEWRTPGLGAIIGSGLARNRDAEENKTSAKGIERLWRILVTMAAHLIWVLRCERVLNKNNAPFTVEEVENRWKAELNARLDLDRRATNKKYERKAVSAETVRETWKNTLTNEESLPEDWMNTNSGVLVGIETDKAKRVGRRPKRKKTRAPH
ncbi:hypothetical protein PQX77_019729 [Marasmius sp. AFHP31]|nr:hypothetical protein PQX77_019729 [Marasmius sp. AFHP31]